MKTIKPRVARPKQAIEEVPSDRLRCANRQN